MLPPRLKVAVPATTVLPGPARVPPVQARLPVTVTVPAPPRVPALMVRLLIETLAAAVTVPPRMASVPLPLTAGEEPVKV